MNGYPENFFYTIIISVPAIAFIFAVIIKGITVKGKTGSWSIESALWSGGMPSVHTSVVVSLATAFALKYGLNSDPFAMVMAFTVIIIYDAINVRFEAGLHAAAINQSLGQKKFKESLWHLPSEAFAWAILWIFTAIILYYTPIVL